MCIRDRTNSLSTLLTTSLRVPRLPEGLITRSILIERMGQALRVPLTLISAPAGFGKTTLLSQWVSKSQNDRLGNRVAWVSLESESDPFRFWTYILTALEEIKAGISESALALFESSQPPIHTAIRILINSISEVGAEFVLVLDDYHPVSYTHLTLPTNREV